MTTTAMNAPANKITFNLTTYEIIFSNGKVYKLDPVEFLEWMVMNPHARKVA